jgi:hypothetical protein
MDAPAAAEPYVRPEELRHDPNRPLSTDQQLDLRVRIELETRRTGKPVMFPDLQRLPIDPAAIALFDELRCNVQ